MKIKNNIFTKREQDIILLILSGMNKREIAETLFLSISTIKSHVENIYEKFNVHNKAQFIIYILKNKIVEFDEDD